MTNAPSAQNAGTGKAEFTGGLTVSMQVTDRKRSIAWFSEHLGCTLLYDVEEMGWCELSTPVESVQIGMSEVESVQVGGGPVLTWGVKSVDEARAALEKAGVKFDGETREYPGMVRLATFFDPDGNTFMFFEALGDM